MSKLFPLTCLLFQGLVTMACSKLSHHGYNPSPTKGLFNIPQGATARVSIIDSTLRVGALPPKDLVSPKIPGFDVFPPVPAWSFLIESSTGQRVLFDLGVPPNLNESFSPPLLEAVASFGWDISVEKHVVDILREHGVAPRSISAIIWSHSHWDHIGDPSTFPHSADLVVGPGFKEGMLPAYPADPKSFLREEYFEGRNLVQIDFTKNPLTIGPFPAFDFFGDGAFYLLDAPGHAVGHMAALVRTTNNPDTFMFMGGDLCHHGAEIRPSEAVPIPPDVQDRYPCPIDIKSCPGVAEFQALNLELGRGPDGPALDPAVFTNFSQAHESIVRAQMADAHDDIFVVWAHDTDINGTVDLFPLPANDWKKKGWREKVFWRFLVDLAPAAVSAPKSGTRASICGHT